MYDLDRRVRVPTELDCNFQLTIGDPFDEGETLLDEGTPIGVHEIEYEGALYRVVCSVEHIRDVTPEEE